MPDDEASGDRSGMARRTYLTTTGVLAFAGASGNALADGSSEASEGSGDGEPTEIDECTTITEPGEYVLTTDLEAEAGENCLEIRASDVTLDGQGQTLSQSESTEPEEFPFDAGSTGVLVAPPTARSLAEAVDDGEVPEPTDGEPSDVTLRDLTVTGFHTGVALSDSEGCRLEGITVEDADTGLFAFRSDGNELVDDETDDCEVGIHLLDASGNRLSENRIGGDAEQGILLERFATGADDNALVGNTVDADLSHSEGGGLHVVASAGNRLEGNDVAVERGHPVVLEDARNNDLADNELRGDSGVLFERADGNGFVGNDVEGGDTRGVDLQGSHGNTLRDNTVFSDFDVVFLADSHDNTIEGNAVEGPDRGVRLVRSNGNTVADNALPSKDWGIILGESHANTLEGNSVAVADSEGIRIDASNGNTIEDNAVEEARHGLYLTDSNRNALIDNEATENLENGVQLERCDDNTFSGNVTNDNGVFGLFLTGSSFNTGVGNVAEGNGRAPVFVDGGEGNRIEFDEVVTETDFEGESPPDVTTSGADEEPTGEPGSKEEK